MGRAVVRVTLLGLLLAVVTALPVKDDWDIYSFHINSTVTNRYAVTVIRSRVANRMNESKEIEFHVRIPKNAFISKFKMLIEGQEYDGVVKAKEQAEQQYAQAVSHGESAGIVSSVGRTLEEFKTSVTVAAHKKVTFELTYEELLKRRLGKYELQIHARPMQPVKDFKVDVYINEDAGINFVEVKGGLSTKALANAITKTHADEQVWVYFYPTVDQQKICDSCDDNGMNGDLVIVYDVNRNSSLGDIKKSAGYFVHHFAPSNLSRIPKNVIFVIDQSGSMHGRKIEQTRTALVHILNDLAEEDYFGLITFDSQIFQWKQELVRASKNNVESAKNFARNIKDNGATDINRALLKGVQMLNAHPREGSASILILLTDGDPTTGETNLEVIQSNIRKAIAGKFPLYCLGFGFDVNFEFLEKMSLQNNGMARRIYTDADADLQLTGFYEEVATPLLTDVTMIYIGGTNLTQTNFSQYYNGSEIVVAGQISDNDIDTFTPQVVAISSNSTVVFSDLNPTAESTEPVSDSLMQRIWAYLTVKQLLDKELQLSGSEKEDAKNDALKLSLKYGFVTPLTSMVVTKPQGENTDVLHKPREGQTQLNGGVYGQPVLPGLTGAHGVPGQHGVYGASSPGMYARPPHIFFRKPSSRKSNSMGAPFYHQFAEIPVLQTTKVLIADDFDFSVGMVFPTIVPATNVPAFHRFMLKTEDQSLPLCFDVPVDFRLKLLHHPNMELSVNGELDSSENSGFKKIIVHVKSDHHIEINTIGITVQEGQTKTSHAGQDPITVESVTVIRRDKEVDIATGDTRIIILIHQQGGKEFLWPALRQQPSDNNVTGILTVKAEVYEEVPQSSPIKLKIKNQEIPVTRSDAVDYSIPSSPTLSCWLTSAEAALQRPVDDFLVTQL